jgi:hypothetical protein
MSPETVGLIAATLATLGWLYTARRARALARKQHTINVMLQAHFNQQFREALRIITPTVRAKQGPPEPVDNEISDILYNYRFVLNHYEFVASGLRNGDFDELLVRDSERGTILALFEAAEAFIYKVRINRDRQSAYEHLEWIYARWKRKPPGRVQKLIETIIDRPFAGTRHDPQS